MIHFGCWGSREGTLLISFIFFRTYIQMNCTLFRDAMRMVALSIGALSQACPREMQSECSESRRQGWSIWILNKVTRTGIGHSRWCPAETLCTFAFLLKSLRFCLSWLRFSIKKNEIECCLFYSFHRSPFTRVKVRNIFLSKDQTLPDSRRLNRLPRYNSFGARKIVSNPVGRKIRTDNSQFRFS